MGGKGSGARKGEASGKGFNDFHERKALARDMDAHERYMAFGRLLMEEREPVDMGDERAVMAAVMDALDICDAYGVRPMVKTYAYCLGIDPRVFTGLAQGDVKYANWHGGIVTPPIRQILRKAYDFLSVYWEQSMLDDGGNPVKWIFLGKNYFGMRDQTEHVNVNLDATPQLEAPSEVLDRYRSMVGRPEPKRLSEGDAEAEYEEP